MRSKKHTPTNKKQKATNRKQRARNRQQETKGEDRNKKQVQATRNSQGHVLGIPPTVPKISICFST